jgi:HK97 family phage prohead protease
MGYAYHTLMQFKTVADDKAGAFSGYASTYNLDLQNDKIQPGAFAQSITDKRGKVPIFFNHEDWIGVSTSLAEDGKGLIMAGEIALGNSDGADAYALLQKAAELDFRVGMSIGFTAQDWDFDGNVRTLKEINLYEISITPFPAQPKAFVSDVKTFRDLEKHLREVERFSKSDARRIMRVVADYNQSSGGMLDDASPFMRRSQALRALTAQSLWKE